MKSSVIEPFASFGVNFVSAVTSLPFTTNGLLVSLFINLPFKVYSLPTCRSLYSTLSWIVTDLDVCISFVPSVLSVAVVFIEGIFSSLTMCLMI
ncbi:Uncharacterised protein [Streptococcus pneumoniae]|nr:Uncharacterised protein [Streptococcus pneumoniae]